MGAYSAPRESESCQTASERPAMIVVAKLVAAIARFTWIVARVQAAAELGRLDREASG